MSKCSSQPNTRVANVAASFFRVSCRTFAVGRSAFQSSGQSLFRASTGCNVSAIVEKAQTRSEKVHIATNVAFDRRRHRETVGRKIVRQQNRIRETRRTVCISNPGGDCVFAFRKMHSVAIEIRGLRRNNPRTRRNLAHDAARSPK